MANTVNEKSPLYMTVAFKDELGAPLVPVTVEWRLDNEDVGSEIVPWTALIGPASTMSVVIPGSNNLIVTETNVKEDRVFGIRANANLGSEAHEEFHYQVINLTGPTGV